jgi:CubicO group peptidase (beta-lactamase class C family)
MTPAMLLRMASHSKLFTSTAIMQVRDVGKIHLDDTVSTYLPGFASNLSLAKNASAGIALRCSAFITLMQAAEVRNLDHPSDTRDLPCTGVVNRCGVIKL